MKHASIALVVGAAALTLTGCSSGTNSSDAGTTSQGTAASVASTTSQPPITVKAGASHRFAGGTVKVSSMKCSTDPIPNSRVGKDGSAVDATPKAGSEFCIIRGTVTNQTKRPIDIPAFYGYEDATGAEFASKDSDPSSANLDDVDYGDDVNPGDVARWAEIFEVRKGKHPVALLTQDEQRTFAEPGTPRIRFLVPKSSGATPSTEQQGGSAPSTTTPPPAAGGEPNCDNPSTGSEYNACVQMGKITPSSPSEACGSFDNPCDPPPDLQDPDGDVPTECLEWPRPKSATYCPPIPEQ